MTSSKRARHKEQAHNVLQPYVSQWNTRKRRASQDVYMYCIMLQAPNSINKYNLLHSNGLLNTQIRLCTVPRTWKVVLG